MSRHRTPRGLSIGLDLAAEWSLSPVQWAFVSCEKRFSFYVGGLGAGKTFAGAVRAIVRALDYPGSLGLIGAPTYPMLRDATQRMLLELLPEPYVASYNKAEGHLRLRNGAEVLFRSLDAPDRVRGLNLAWFWLDEAPLCGYYAWQVLKGRLRQRGFVTAAWATGTPRGRDGFARDFELERRRNHALFRATTYANAHNLPPGYVEELGYTGAFHDQEVLGLFTAFEGLVYAFDTGPDGHVRDPRVLNAAAAEEDAAAAEQRKDETQRTHRFAALRKGKQEARNRTTEHTEITVQDVEQADMSGVREPESHVDTAGKHPLSDSASFAFSSAFSAFKSPSASVPSVASLWKSVIGGIDWGYTNPATALVFALDGDGRAWQVDEFYQRRAALEETLLPAILELSRRYGVRTWYCGPDEPEHITRLAEALAREGLPTRAIKADNAVRAGIQTVTGMLARRADGTRGLYVSPRCVHTIAEYQSYQYASSAGAGSPFPLLGEGGQGVQAVPEQPLKQNDHAMDATRYALHTALGQRRATSAYLAALRRRRQGDDELSGTQS